MKNRYDVIVVGAGPAGSTTALHAAKNGCSVLLLEKDREIGIPVRCAEAVGEIGLSKVLEPKEHWFSNRIEGFRLFAPDGTKVNVNHNEQGWVLDRKIFDRELAEMAADEGVEILTKAYVYDLIKNDNIVSGVKVKYLNNEYEFCAPIIIGADGVESRVGRWAGLKTHLSLKNIETCAQYTLTNIDIDHRYCDFYFSKEWAPGGYVWIFPKGKDSANVGLGISGEHSSPKHAFDYLNLFIDKKFPNAAKINTVAGGVPSAPYNME